MTEKENSCLLFISIADYQWLKYWSYSHVGGVQYRAERQYLRPCAGGAQNRHLTDPQKRQITRELHRAGCGPERLPVCRRHAGLREGERDR